jgi:DNA-binding XRE family transcriptional regulator
MYNFLDFKGAGCKSKLQAKKSKPNRLRLRRRYMGGKNSLKEVRESLLMSKAELARDANVSPITITRIEKGLPCRMETKRKILLALGLSLSEKEKIFKE